MADKNSNNGVYWFIGISVVGIGGYILIKKWYDDNVNNNPAVKTYNWFTDIFS